MPKHKQLEPDFLKLNTVQLEIICTCNYIYHKYEGRERRKEIVFIIVNIAQSVFTQKANT